MSKIEIYQQRIQKKINPGDIKFNVNTIDFTIFDKRIFFHNLWCYNKKYDYVLLKNNTLKIGIQHQHISKNLLEQVIAAGSILVDIDGIILHIDNQSGTFQFSEQQQQSYLDRLHSIVQLDYCDVYSVDYKQYNPIEPTLRLCYNKFRKNINRDCFLDLHKKFLKDIDREKWMLVLEWNNFDWEKYYNMNEDLHTYFNKNKKQVMEHFGMFGQYERGRAIGYY